MNIKMIEIMLRKSMLKVVSFIKSGIRIAACIAGAMGYLWIGFIGLAIAEIVGIIEELV